MLTISLKKLTKFTSGDNCVLREFLHPDKAELKIRYSLAHAIVKPGQTTAKHKLKTSEVYYILSGKGIMMIDDEKRAVNADDVVYIPPRAVQCIMNSGKKDLTFICIVDPAWRKEDEIILEKK